jgi:serine/threonine protein kinase
MLSRQGEVKILDLGLAAGSVSPPCADDLTGPGQVVGTLDYLAPEQADPGSPVDTRADVYSLGFSLFYLLTGQTPYTSPHYSTPQSKIIAHAAGAVPDARETRPDVRAGLAAILTRMMAKNPADRFSAPAEVAIALAPYCAGHDLTPAPVGSGDGTARAVGGNRVGRFGRTAPPRSWRYWSSPDADRGHWALGIATNRARQRGGAARRRAADPGAEKPSPGG